MKHSDIENFFNQLNHDYLKVHQKKEELFWQIYMATSQDHEAFTKAEEEWKSFISDPLKLQEVRKHLKTLQVEPEEDEAELVLGLKGWEALFQVNVIETPEALNLLHEVMRLENNLFAKRQALKLTQLNEKGQQEEATLGMLATNLETNPLLEGRKSSLETFRKLETWLLDNGFIPIVKARNTFARSQGFKNYFDYKIKKTESMTAEELFVILSKFEVQTRAAQTRGLEILKAKAGEEALKPWNVKYYKSGTLQRELDPYFPFSKSLGIWVKNFRRMGISFREAQLQLDLFERKGKYQNGFCHGPVPAHYDQQTWVPGHINFTSDAQPDHIGSGYRALNTLFHEGGHAAHFANVCQNSPCFAQEFYPTSMAYAETQSMFCDSLIGDADWLTCYAKDLKGQSIPKELIKRQIEEVQPFRAMEERMILLVPYFESALYGLSDQEVTKENILALARKKEQEILGIESPRPLLAIPHLLSQDSAASYQGYLLANMAVYQTRHFFQSRFGYLTNNPMIGPLLAKHYWAEGNRKTHNQTIRDLTGEDFNPQYLADDCNMTPQEAWKQAQEAIKQLNDRGEPEDHPKDLDAHIKIVHGTELIADNTKSEVEMEKEFTAWVNRHYQIPGGN